MGHLSNKLIDACVLGKSLFEPVAFAVDEEPFVYHYGAKEDGMVLVPNMVFTVEPMINMGNYRCRRLDDGWTAVTRDGLLSAQWEHTVRVTEDGVDILSEVMK